MDGKFAALPVALQPPAAAVHRVAIVELAVQSFLDDGKFCARWTSRRGVEDKAEAADGQLPRLNLPEMATRGGGAD